MKRPVLCYQMEVSETSWGVGQGCPLSPVLLDIFPEKITHKAFTPQQLSENDCFAGDTVQDAEESDIPLSSVSIGEDHSATCSLPTTSIYWEAINKNSSGSLKD